MVNAIFSLKEPSINTALSLTTPDPEEKSLHPLVERSTKQAADAASLDDRDVFKFNSKLKVICDIVALYRNANPIAKKALEKELARELEFKHPQEKALLMSWCEFALTLARKPLSNLESITSQGRLKTTSVEFELSENSALVLFQRHIILFDELVQLHGSVSLNHCYEATSRHIRLFPPTSMDDETLFRYLFERMRPLFLSAPPMARLRFLFFWHKITTSYPDLRKETAALWEDPCMQDVYNTPPWGACIKLTGSLHLAPDKESLLAFLKQKSNPLLKMIENLPPFQEEATVELQELYIGMLKYLSIRLILEASSWEELQLIAQSFLISLKKDPAHALIFTKFLMRYYEISSLKNASLEETTESFIWLLDNQLFDKIELNTSIFQISCTEGIKLLQAWSKIESGLKLYSRMGKITDFVTKSDKPLSVYANQWFIRGCIQATGRAHLKTAQQRLVDPHVQESLKDPYSIAMLFGLLIRTYSNDSKDAIKADECLTLAYQGKIFENSDSKALFITAHINVLKSLDCVFCSPKIQPIVKQSIKARMAARALQLHSYTPLKTAFLGNELEYTYDDIYVLIRAHLFLALTPVVISDLTIFLSTLLNTEIEEKDYKECISITVEAINAIINHGNIEDQLNLPLFIPKLLPIWGSFVSQDDQNLLFAQVMLITLSSIRVCLSSKKPLVLGAAKSSFNHVSSFIQDLKTSNFLPTLSPKKREEIYKTFNEVNVLIKQL